MIDPLRYSRSKPAAFEHRTERRIERTVALFGDSQRKAHRREEHGAHRHRLADVRRQLTQLAPRLEAGTDTLDLAKPRERALRRAAVARSDLSVTRLRRCES